MSDAHNAPVPRPRGRKIRFGFAALGILLVAFVGFLVTPGRGAKDPVALQLQKIVTNDATEVYAFFLVTNVGPHECTMIGLQSQERRDGTWSTFDVAKEFNVFLTAGDSRLLRVKIPPGGSKWRARSLTPIEPTRLQYIRINLLAELNKRDAAEASYRSMLRTNYSAEFPR